MTATKAQFDRELLRHGATLDRDSCESGSLVIDAPPGKVWASDPGLHALVVPFRQYSQSWLPDARAEAIERMSMGVEDCEIEDCDVCGR